MIIRRRPGRHAERRPTPMAVVPRRDTGWEKHVSEALEAADPAPQAEVTAINRIPGLGGETTVAIPVWKPPSDVATLRQVRDRLKALDAEAEDGGEAAPPPLPATLLRAVPRDGSGGGSKEILTGWPTCEGVRVTEAGLCVEGLCIGDDGDVSVVLESASAEYLDELALAAWRAAAGIRARDARAGEDDARLIGGAA